MISDDRGFWLIDLPPLPPATMAQFAALPLDIYTPGNHRFRRFSTVRMWHDGDQWQGEQQPQRPFLQPRAVNALVGGKPRIFEPIAFDPTRQMASAFEQIAIDRTRDYALNVHQIRVVTGPETRGVLVPEGPHRDGHWLVLTAVFDRHNIDGGVSQLLPLGGGEPFFTTTLAPCQALIIEDERMWHNATEIVSRDGTQGHRDIWIVSINPWEARRYGEAFEQRATENA